MSNSTKKKEESEAQNKRVTIIVITVLVIAVLALFGIVIYLLVGNGSDKEEQDSKRAVESSVRTVVDESSADDVMNQMRKEVEEGMFECQMSMTWNFKDGKAESKDAYVANSTNNTHPICFDVYMKDTEELLYASPVIPVGSDLKGIKLDKELPAGKYKATVMYKLLSDTESQEEISSAGFVVTINVLN